MLDNITGDCASGMSLVNVDQVVLRGINATGYAGPLLAIDYTTGTDLEVAVKYVPRLRPPRPLPAVEDSLKGTGSERRQELLL